MSLRIDNRIFHTAGLIRIEELSCSWVEDNIDLFDSK